MKVDIFIAACRRLWHVLAEDCGGLGECAGASVCTVDANG